MLKNDLILAEVDNEAMLIDVDKGLSFFLNETGLLIYKMLKDKKGEEEIKAYFIEEYDVEKKEVEKDIRQFKELLNKKGILWGKINT